MKETEDIAAQGQQWLTHLLSNDGKAAITVAAGAWPAAGLACVIAEALAHDRTLLVVTPDDAPLADIANAIDLDLRPLCLVLPAAEFALRIALRATLSLLKSRLARASGDTAGPAWQSQRRRLGERSALWQAGLDWNARDDDAEPWPAGIVELFPVRVLPLTLALDLRASAEWTIVLDPSCMPGLARGPWPEARRTLFLEFAGGARPPAASSAADRRRAEIALLTQELADLELELATAQMEIAGFTRRYHERVGTRLVRLDELRARLAARHAIARPADAEAARAAEAARRQAERSRGEARSFARLDEARQVAFAPSADLKRLYRKIARQIHPDRASGEADLAWRTRLMAEANRAYRAGDGEALAAVLARWQAGAGRTAGAEQADGLEAQIARLKRRIAAIEAELNRLFASKLYELFTAAAIARRAGRDLLAEMAARLDADIAAVEAQLDAAA